MASINYLTELARLFVAVFHVHPSLIFSGKHYYNGLYYKRFTIGIYDNNDNMIVIYDRNDSGLYYKTTIITNLGAKSINYTGS
jgi:hypothetical protein